jgi:hypothetical protein
MAQRLSARCYVLKDAAALKSRRTGSAAALLANMPYALYCRPCRSICAKGRSNGDAGEDCRC